MNSKIDTRSIGLDVGLSFARWLTGAENLHYGLWTGLEVSAANLRRAQEAYTDKLFALLPPGRLRILDIGGGAGETARKLVALGHRVEIVIPSAFLAERCRANVPQAVVHQAPFETAAVTGPFDLCLFSESFQYMPFAVSLPKCLGLLAPGGTILIADCFRSDAFRGGTAATVGGGHFLTPVLSFIAGLPVRVTHHEDITDAVAPSVDLEQGLFHVFGHALARIDGEVAAKRPKTHWLILRALRAFTSLRMRARLMQRLTQNTRTAEVFAANNRYLMLRLEKTG